MLFFQKSQQIDKHLPKGQLNLWTKQIKSNEEIIEVLLENYILEMFIPYMENTNKIKKNISLYK